MTLRQNFPEPYFTLELDGQEVQRYPLNRPRTSIGRARDAEIQIAVRGVSRSHAVVHRDDQGHCRIEDLGSANGTFVNGARIDKVHALAVGDVINFLDYSLRFHREGVNPAMELDTGLESALDTDSSELESELDDMVPTEEGPALRRKKSIVTAKGDAPRPRSQPAATRWEVELDDPELGKSVHVIDREVTMIGGEGPAKIRLSGRRLEPDHSLLVRVEQRLLFVRLSPVHMARINGTARMVSFLEPDDQITIGGSTIVVRKK